MEINFFVIALKDFQVCQMNLIYLIVILLIIVAGAFCQIATITVNSTPIPTQATTPIPTQAPTPIPIAACPVSIQSPCRNGGQCLVINGKDYICGEHSFHT